MPKEGAVLALDNMVIHKSAPRPDLAYKFIDFMLEGRNSAELTNLIGSGNPNTDAMQYIKRDVKGNKAVFPTRRRSRSSSSRRISTRRIAGSAADVDRDQGPLTANAFDRHRQPIAREPPRPASAHRRAACRTTDPTAKVTPRLEIVCRRGSNLFYFHRHAVAPHTLRRSDRSTGAGITDTSDSRCLMRAPIGSRDGVDVPPFDG